MDVKLEPEPGGRADAPPDARAEAREARRTRILDATYALACQGGFEAVQMRTVADDADVALGTLYRYFPSKIHLLVSALERELQEAGEKLRTRPAPAGTSSDRVVDVLHSVGRNMRGNQGLTEAMTRAFMFADASAKDEIERVADLLTSLLAGAMSPDTEEPGEDQRAIARAIGDLWLAALVAWVTGRMNAAETTRHMEATVRLVLRD